MTINWPLIGFIVVMFAVGLTLFIAFIALVLHLRKPGAVAAAEAQVKQFAATPTGHAVVSDLERLAALLSQRLMTAPPVSIPGHPALTAAVDAAENIAQKSAQVKQAVAELSAATMAAPAK